MNKIKVCSPSSWKNPKNHLNTLLKNDWYSILNGLFSSIFIATHDFYRKKNIQPSLFPITTGSISSPMGLGSDSLPVKVKIRNNEVYLADSMQFCLEIGARLNQKGAYYIMPTFRGENIDSRHLNEFIHSETEIKGDIKDVMKLAEDYIKYLIRYLLKYNAEQIVKVAGSVEHLENALKRKFKKLSYKSAVDELKNIEGAIKKIGKDLVDITPVGEKILLEKYGDFLWLTGLPWKLVPFYQAHNEKNRETAHASDLLAGIGEILGCGQRVLTVEDLDVSLQEHNVNPKEYEWYRKMREINTVQTGGYGLGLERFILWLLKHNDIRDCSILLRDHNNVTAP